MRSTALQIDDLKGQEINLKSKSSLIHDVEQPYGRTKHSELASASVKVFNINENFEKNVSIEHSEREDYVEGDYIVENANRPPMLPAEKRKIKLKILFVSAIFITSIFTYLVLDLFSNSL